MFQSGWGSMRNPLLYATVSSVCCNNRLIKFLLCFASSNIYCTLSPAFLPVSKKYSAKFFTSWFGLNRSQHQVGARVLSKSRAVIGKHASIEKTFRKIFHKLLILLLNPAILKAVPIFSKREDFSCCPRFGTAGRATAACGCN